MSLKPGHMDLVRDFDFKLNLFSHPYPLPPPNYSGRTNETVHY